MVNVFPSKAIRISGCFAERILMDARLACNMKSKRLHGKLAMNTNRFLEVCGTAPVNVLWMNDLSIQLPRYNAICFPARQVVERGDFDFFLIFADENREVAVCWYEDVLEVGLRSHFHFSFIDYFFVPYLIGGNYLQKNCFRIWQTEKNSNHEIQTKTS